MGRFHLNGKSCVLSCLDAANNQTLNWHSFAHSLIPAFVWAREHNANCVYVCAILALDLGEQSLNPNLLDPESQRLRLALRNPGERRELSLIAYK